MLLHLGLFQSSGLSDCLNTVQFCFIEVHLVSLFYRLWRGISFGQLSIRVEGSARLYGRGRSPLLNSERPTE